MKTPELILLQLKSLGPQSAKMLAERIAITTMGGTSAFAATRTTGIGLL